MSKLLSAAEVAAQLRVSTQAVYRLRERGTLASITVAGRRLWRVETVEAYERDREAQSRRRPASPIRQGQRVLTLGEAVAELAAKGIQN